MTFELAFVEEALSEWERLDGSVKQQFKKKIAQRLQSPRVAASQLSGHKDRYKIKLRSVGYRLVYEVKNTELLVLVLVVAVSSGQARPQRGLSSVRHSVTAMGLVVACLRRLRSVVNHTAN